MSSSISSFSGFVLRWLLPYAALSALSLLLVDALFSEVVLAANPASGAAKLQRLHRGVDPDEVSIFGSSRALGAIVPSQLGVRAFNYGIEGARSDLLELMLRTLAGRPGRAPVIVNLDYELFLPGPISTGDVGNLVPSASFPPYRAFLERAGSYESHYSVPGLRYFGSFETHLKTAVQVHVSPTKSFDHGAACDLNVLSPERFQGHVAARRARPVTIALDQARARSFRSALLALEPRPVVLTLSPYHPSYTENTDLTPEARRYFAELASLPNARFVDVDTSGFTDQLFLDTSHLNCDGAQRYTKALAERLRALALALPSTPSDPARPARK